MNAATESHLTALGKKTVVCVGVGGARSYLENLARSGVQRFILLDGDIVEEKNLATQGVFQDEVGCAKVDCAAQAIRRIVPNAHITAAKHFLDDGLTDDAFAALVGPDLLAHPGDVLICGCTDSFPAQARTAALALKYATPYLAAQLYAGGLAGELCFTYPGVTTGGCPRCAMESRYRAYLEQDYQNDVTSQGVSIFATERLNALKGAVSLLLLLGREPGPSPWWDLLDRVAGRNFVLIRLNPIAGQTLHLPVLDRMDHLAGDLACFDETLWIPQKPNAPENGYPACPLCGGVADLSALAHTIADTRILV